LLGFITQKAYLGDYEGENVVVLKDFINQQDNFVAFNDVGESTIDENKDLYQYSYQDIMEMLRINNKLDSPIKTIERFWDMFIVDALLGNFDRHGANWGFIKHKGIYTLAPVFDNGSSLFPNLTEKEDMKIVMDSEAETDKRIYLFPTSQIKLNGKKSSYFDIISSLEFDECNKALRRIYLLINLNEIYVMIDAIKEIEEFQKKFYKYVIKQRYEKIIKYSYQKLTDIDRVIL
jgi:hypothetical protein